MARSPLVRSAALLLVGGMIEAVSGQVFKIGTPDEIRQSARTLAYDLMTYYKGNQSGQIPGILPGPPSEGKGDYYWWEGGAMMGTYIDYWKLTGDTTYNDVVAQGILHQAGDHSDFQHPNWTASLGNDDQAFWGMAAMLAAENKFPDPPKDKPQWLAMAQGVFNTQASPDRHDNECGGGLRWQIPPTNVGYDYKNTIANACFFNLGARLARYTNNQTFEDWATKTFQWLWDVNYIDHENWRVYDGGHIPHNCTDINMATFSYSASLLLQGSAFLYNKTQSDLWKERVLKLTDMMLENFFPNGIAYEPPCEHDHGACTADMLSFKGYTARWLAVTTQLAPLLVKDKILPVLRTSAEAAVKQCTGGATGRRCGFYWTEGVYVDPSVDRTTGAGETMNVLAAVSSLLIDEPSSQVAPPVTNTTGGTSQGDPNAGDRSAKMWELPPITTADKAGASILTILLLAGAAGTLGWMSLGD